MSGSEHIKVENKNIESWLGKRIEVTLDITSRYREFTGTLTGVDNHGISIGYKLFFPWNQIRKILLDKE